MRFYGRCADWTFAEASPDAAQPIRWHREHWILVATAALLTLLSAVAMPGWAHAMRPNYSTPSVYVTTPLLLPALPASTSRVTVKPRWKSVTVQPGQTLSAIFQQQGLGASDLQRVENAATDSHVLDFVHPGDVFGFQFGAGHKLDALRFDPDLTHRVTFRFHDDGSVSRDIEVRPVNRRQQVAHAVIHTSLYAAAQKAGINQAVMNKLARIFKSDINFRKDIRPGDDFTVIYETIYRKGQYLNTGEVLAAEFNNRGHRYTAFRFTLPDGESGYYSADGRALRTALLRIPVKYTRISSPFGMRVDPVTHHRHLHEGVDLAAPKGTPIHAAGNGVITVRGWVHGYGRYIRIRDTSTYSTAYAHMSRFASGLHIGSHVHQGQVIGYVGATGWATGPHLHYEVLVDGKPVNPLTVTLPKPKPLPPTLLAHFKQHAKPMLASMQHLDAFYQLARAKSSSSNG